MGKIDGLAHIGVFVTDLDRSKKFYEDILEFDTLWECQIPDNGEILDVAFVKNGNLMLELIKKPGAPAKPAGITDHIAIHVDDIEEQKKKLEEKGVKFETAEVVSGPMVFENGAKWITFHGPDGETLELNEVL